MKSGKIFYIIIVVAVVASAVFVIWKKTVRNDLILTNPPIASLLFVKKTGGEFTPEQQKNISEFKAKLLARAGLGVKPTKQEKEIFNVVMSDQEMILPNGDIVVNQSVLKFNPEEVDLISKALKK